MMKLEFKKIVNFLFLLIITLQLSSCTEPYALQTNNYEEVLVVEATITNELKNQEIVLSKTTPLENKEVLIETGANVYISDDQGNQYNFDEQGGKYISENAFQIMPNRTYKLHINTRNGKSYESSAEVLPPVNPMQDVTATVETQDSIRGVAIHVDSFDPTNKSKYYRYEYEETYNIITPDWNTQKAIVIPPTNPSSDGTIAYIPNSPDTKVCYNTVISPNIMLANTSAFSEDKLHYSIRFISHQNYIISHRYSILVRQYILSLASYDYYATLKKISGSGSILSPLQPGFVSANINSLDNPNEKVVGYFDVTSVSTKRIYFNYADLFPFESLPPYYTDCTPFCYGEQPACTHYPPDAVIADINNGFITLHAPNLWVNAPCGDCTTFASNIKPSFWVD